MQKLFVNTSSQKVGIKKEGYYMFLDVYKNEDNSLKCSCHNCAEQADVLLELVGDEGMPLCKQHCFNTLKNLGINCSKLSELLN